MKKHITFLTFLWADGPSGSVLESFLKGLCLQSPIYEAEDRRFDGLLQLQMQKAEKLLSAITDRRRRMRQKQSKKYNQELSQELVDRYERYRKILKDLTLMSDSFMRAVLKNPKCTEEVLRIILNKN